mmetsp:Transcript_1260/g.2870  ORF Transcript_1260/g.2870 Transcript_1260/m.2870 type:complete len:252 (+) Transcript_1260:380-1135(+)
MGMGTLPLLLQHLHISTPAPLLRPADHHHHVAQNTVQERLAPTHCPRAAEAAEALVGHSHHVLGSLLHPQHLPPQSHRGGQGEGAPLPQQRLQPCDVCPHPLGPLHQREDQDIGAPRVHGRQAYAVPAPRQALLVSLEDAEGGEEVVLQRIHGRLEHAAVQNGPPRLCVRGVQDQLRDLQLAGMHEGGDGAVLLSGDVHGRHSQTRMQQTGARGQGQRLPAVLRPLLIHVQEYMYGAQLQQEERVEARRGL